MTTSPTEESVDTTGAQMSPTGQEQQQATAEQSNQETNSREQSQESVSDDTAHQQTQTHETKTEEQGGSTTDDGLAKFAKSQGFTDVAQLSESEQRLLKIAYDNQKAYRNSKNDGKTLHESTSNMGNQGLEAKVEQLEYERKMDKFFAPDSGRDRSLEASMVEIVERKAQEYGNEYAWQLSRDLPSLYAMATLEAQSNQSGVDAEAIRREERASIRKQSTAADTPAHASTGHVAPVTNVDDAWIENVYDPSNPEHRALADKYFAGQQ